MVTEEFLNFSCQCLLQENAEHITYSTVEDISSIVKFYSNSGEIVTSNQLKFDLVKTICKLKLENKSTDSVLDSIFSTNKYETLNNFVKSITQRELSETKQLEYCKQIKSRKKLVVLLSDYPELCDFMNSFEENSFDDIDSALGKYEEIITKLYSRYSSEKRVDVQERMSSLDLSSGDLEFVLDQIKKNYDVTGAVSTGYPQLDKYMHNGFHPRRTYVFAAISGDGKSTLLLNFIKNALSTRNNTSHKDIYVYVTMENLIDESLLRLYCSMTGNQSMEVIKNIESEKTTIITTIRDAQNKCNKTLVMLYFPSGSITASEILLHTDKIKSQYGEHARLRALYIDYLDLLKTSKKSDVRRFELGQISMDLKVLAITAECPVITATQLNRTAYNKDDNNLSIDTMGESIQKVEHSDFVGLLRFIPDVEEDSTSGEVKIKNAGHGDLIVRIGKNRAGPKEVEAKLRANFLSYQINDPNIMQSTLKIDATSVIPGAII